MISSLNNTGAFLINTIFDLYLMVLAARLILAFSKANYFNPITRFVITLTQPIINPIRRVIPNYDGIEFSTLLVILVLQLIKFSLIGAMFITMPAFDSLLIISITSSIKLILTLLFYSIMISAIMSLLTPNQTPFTQVLYELSSPFLRPFQRMIPPVGGFDISPIPALLILQIFIRVL